MNDDHRAASTAPNRPARHPQHARFAVASAAIGLAVALQPTLASAGCQVESIEMPVRMVGTRAVAVVGINGTPTPLTVDSGAFFSMLTEAAATQLQLPQKRSALRVEGITGRMDAKTTVVDKLKLFKGEIEHVEFVVGGNEPGAGTMGLMGRNILAFTDMEYDLAHGVIKFQYPNDDCRTVNMAYWAGSTPASQVELLSDYHSNASALRAELKLNGRDVVALFDTGATTVVTARAASRAGIADADRKPVGILTGVGRGTAQAWTASFDTFQIGGETIRDTRLRIGDFDLGDAQMLLGIDFFLSHRIYVSKQQSKMFFTYNGGPVFSSAPRRSATEPADDGTPDTAQPTTADALARRGAASAARRDYDSALADLDRALTLDPTSAALLAQRGALHVSMRHPAKALDDFDRALGLDASQVDARWGRAALRLARKDRDGAKGDLDALDKLLAPQAQMRLPMARLYLSLDAPGEALAQLNQWLPAHPSDITRPGAQNSRCWARVLLGVDLAQALDDCDDAVDGDAKNAAFLDSRGWVYLRMAKYGKALADFERSIELAPTNALSLYGRGQAKTRLGDAAAGDADLAAARKLLADVDARMARHGLAADRAPPSSANAP